MAAVSATADARNSGGAPLPIDVRLMHRLTVLLVVVAVLAGLVGGASALMRHRMFVIDSVRIEGDIERNNAKTIRANAMRRIDGSYFTLDLAATKRAFEAVPWVRRATVRRVWPNKLVATLEEHQVAALWQGADGSDRLVNVQGEVFDANLGDVEDEDLPLLSGPDGSSAHVLAMYGRIAAAFKPLSTAVDRLSLSGRGSWKVELDNGSEVELGRGLDDEVVARTERFVRTVPQLIAQYQRPFVQADLRHRDGYAVKLRNVTTHETPLPEPKKPRGAARRERNR